jgi:hypothetical protein
VTASNEPPHVDAQSLNDVDTYVYETIATLEYTGRPATRNEIAAVADVDDQVLDHTLTALTERGLLVRADAGGEPGYEPADRGWSAAPGQARGM